MAITDDHDGQERVLKDMATWYSADNIRDALTEDKISVTEKRVKFVTVKAYAEIDGLFVVAQFVPIRPQKTQQNG